MSHCHQPEFKPLRVKVVTVSDTRNSQGDTSGQLIEEKLRSAGHEVTQRQIVRDTIQEIRDAISSSDAQVFVINGGTGVTKRDLTPEAIEPMFDKKLPGFGELFRHLSYSEIGTATIQSRATAGMIKGSIVFSLPGSTKACRLAMDEIILPQLDSRTKPCSFSSLLDL
jgi:molybdenum cofactor biosynthesis protein B